MPLGKSTSSVTAGSRLTASYNSTCAPRNAPLLPVRFRPMGLIVLLLPPAGRSSPASQKLHASSQLFASPELCQLSQLVWRTKVSHRQLRQLRQLRHHQTATPLFATSLPRHLRTRDPALAVSNNPTCQHRRSHAFVQGRWIPFCVRSGDPETQPTQTPPGRETALCHQPTTSSLHARPGLAVVHDPTCRHRRSHVVVQRRLIPFCLRCGDPNEIDNSPAPFPSSSTCAGTTIAVGARPVLQTLQGFPFDLRRSRVEAGRLME